MGSDESLQQAEIQPGASSAADTLQSLLVDASGQKKKFTRRDEITEILGHQSTANLSLQQKRQIGSWLEQHYGRLSASHSAGSEGIAKEDIIESYSKASWNDGSRFLNSDMRMLKRVAAHFDELALSGKTAAEIEHEDIEGIARGGVVKRTPSDVTTTFPDGSLTRRTNKGDLLKRGADGSLSYEAATISLELAANGTGHLHYNFNELGTERRAEITLNRREDGTWVGKDADGSEMFLSIDEHSIRMRSPELDVLLTTNGGFIRDPSDSKFCAYINPDGSITLTENGRSADIAKSAEGVTLALSDDGSRTVQYGFTTEGDQTPLSYWNDGKGNAGVDGGSMLPGVRASADGTITIWQPNGPIEVKPGPDGRTVAVLPADASVFLRGMLPTVTREPNGTLTYSLPAVIDGAPPGLLKIQFDVEGNLKLIPPVGDEVEFKVPQIIKPKPSST